MERRWARPGVARRHGRGRCLRRAVPHAGHRARYGGARKAVDRDRYERNLALQGRVRESYRPPGRGAGWS